MCILFCHWCCLWLIVALDLQKENFEKVFHEFDSDNGGTIDTDELMDIMNSLNMPRTREEIEEMVALVDEDNVRRCVVSCVV